MSSTNLPILFAYQGTPATVDIGHPSFIPNQSFPVTGPVYIQQFPFSNSNNNNNNNNNNNMVPINRGSKFGLAPYSSPYSSPYMSASATQLPPLSSLVKNVNQSNNNNTVHPLASTASTLQKQAPLRIRVPVSVGNSSVQPGQQQQPSFGQIAQQPASSMYTGYPTPPSPIAPSPQSYIQPNSTLLPQQATQYVPAYRVPMGQQQSFPDNSYVPLIPSRSLSTPLNANESSPQDTSNSVIPDGHVSSRSNSNSDVVEKPLSNPSPTIITKSNGKKMIQRKLSIDIRKTKQCPVCGKKCSRPSTLKTHYFIHTGDNPYKCTWPDCTKAFNVKSNMIRHMKSHAKKLAKHNIH